MKKLVFTFALIIATSSFAQTGFEKIMTEKTAKLQEAKTPEDFGALSNDFARIGEKKKRNGFLSITPHILPSKKADF